MPVKISVQDTEKMPQNDVPETKPAESEHLQIKDQESQEMKNPGEDEKVEQPSDPKPDVEAEIRASEGFVEKKILDTDKDNRNYTTRIKKQNIIEDQSQAILNTET